MSLHSEIEKVAFEISTVIRQRRNDWMIIDHLESLLEGLVYDVLPQTDDNLEKELGKLLGRQEDMLSKVHSAGYDETATRSYIFSLREVLNVWENFRREGEYVETENK